jgi:hypothetical protein
MKSTPRRKRAQTEVGSAESMRDAESMPETYTERCGVS